MEYLTTKELSKKVFRSGVYKLIAKKIIAEAILKGNTWLKQSNVEKPKNPKRWKNLSRHDKDKVHRYIKAGR